MTGLLPHLPVKFHKEQTHWNLEVLSPRLLGKDHLHWESPECWLSAVLRDELELARWRTRGGPDRLVESEKEMRNKCMHISSRQITVWC